MSAGAAAPLFFATPELTQRLDLLHHLIQFSHRFIVVRGEFGSGKSALLQQLLARADENWRPCTLHADVTLGTPQLLDALARCFGLQHRPDPELLSERLADLRQADQLPILFIDDAHTLPSEALVALLQIIFGKPAADEPPLRAVLFAEATIERQLGLAEIQRLMGGELQTLEMPPLAQEECTGYLEYRLAAQGHAGPLPLSPSQLKSMAEASAGLPGRLNSLVGELLERQPSPAKTPPKPQAPPPVPAEPAPPRKPRRAPRLSGRPLLQYLFGALFVVLLASLLALQDRINALFKPAPTSKPAAASAPAREPAQPIKRAPSMPQAIVRAPTTVKPPPVTAPEATRTPTTAPTAGKSPPAPTATTEAPEKAAAKPATKPAPAPLHRERWLLAQRASSYTLQLLGSEDRNKIVRYIRDHHIEAKAAYFRTSLKGKTWYALVYGLYPSYQAAQAAKSSLPTHLNRYEPWPRSLASVHADIRKAGAR